MTIDCVEVPTIDPLTLDSIFPSPGRNDPCYCGSDQKYKRCCEPVDQAVGSELARYRRHSLALMGRLFHGMNMLAMPDEIRRVRLAMENSQ